MAWVFARVYASNRLQKPVENYQSVYQNYKRLWLELSWAFIARSWFTTWLNLGHTAIRLQTLTGRFSHCWFPYRAWRHIVQQNKNLPMINICQPGSIDANWESTHQLPHCRGQNLKVMASIVFLKGSKTCSVSLVSGIWPRGTIGKENQRKHVGARFRTASSPGARVWFEECLANLLFPARWLYVGGWLPQDCQ